MPKILLVEDNEMNRDMLSRRLQRKGYGVVMAHDGEQALVLAGSEDPDLILLEPDVDRSLEHLQGAETVAHDSDRDVLRTRLIRVQLSPIASRYTSCGGPTLAVRRSSGKSPRNRSYLTYHGSPQKPEDSPLEDTPEGVHQHRGSGGFSSRCRSGAGADSAARGGQHHRCDPALPAGRG